MNSRNVTKNYVSKEFTKLLTPLEAKPALICALTSIITFASLSSPSFAFYLLLPLIIITHYFSRNMQWVIFITIAFSVVCFDFSQKNGTDFRGIPAENSCGIVESVQQKQSGLAVIIANSNYKVRLTEKRELLQYPSPGDSICYEASFYPINPPTVLGGFDTKNWLKSQNLLAYGKFKHWTIYKSNFVPEKIFVSFRKWVHKRFAEFLDEAESGLLLGLLAGDKSGIPDALRSDFQRSGLVHVLAISGFHVVLLAGMLMIFLKATGLPHRIVRILAIVLLFIYIPITGGSPAVRRAVLMFAVPQMGALLERPANTLNSLGVALLFIIFPEPNVIWNPGFQLSVAATMGILMSGPLNPFKNLPEFLVKSKCFSFFKNFILEPTYVTLSATLATAPFLIHHFKTLSPFAWLGNIVVVPAISMGMQAGLFALMSPFDFLRENFCYAAKFFLRLASLLTRILSDSPQASSTVGPFNPLILLLLGAIIFTLPSKKNHITKWFRLISIFIFCGLFFASNIQKIQEPKWILTTLDVGQGDSHLITTPKGTHILIDAGDNQKVDSGKDIIIPYLHNIGVSKIDAFIITHPDQDHFGGALSILKTFPVSELWISDCARIEEKENWQQVITEAYKRGIILRDVTQGFLYKENFFEIKVLHPNTKKCTDENTQSVTLRAKGLGHSAILTGDLTVAGEKEILSKDFYLKSDILKLGHHGSKTSSSKKFLEKINPHLAVISSGRKNRFRHPSKQIIQRLDSLKIPYLNTAQKGTLDFIFTKEQMNIKTMIE